MIYQRQAPCCCHHLLAIWTIGYYLPLTNLGFPRPKYNNIHSKQQKTMFPLHHNYPFYNPFFYHMNIDFSHQNWQQLSYSLLPVQEKQAESVNSEKNGEILNESKTLTSSQLIQPQETIENPSHHLKSQQKNSNISSYKNKKHKSNPSTEIQVSTTKIQTQKEGRNANSNFLRMFFRRISQRMQSQPELISYIIKRHKLKIKLEAFREWLELNEVDHRNYVKLPDVRDLFVAGKNNREQAKVMRILLKDFLQNQALCCYLTSKKVKKQAMPHNFYCMKNILKDIFMSPRTL